MYCSDVRLSKMVGGREVSWLLLRYLSSEMTCGQTVVKKYRTADEYAWYQQEYSVRRMGQHHMQTTNGYIFIDIHTYIHIYIYIYIHKKPRSQKNTIPDRQWSPLTSIVAM